MELLSIDMQWVLQNQEGNIDANADGSVAGKSGSFGPCCGSDNSMCDDANVSGGGCGAQGSDYRCRRLAEGLQGLKIVQNFYHFEAKEKYSICEVVVCPSPFYCLTSFLILSGTTPSFELFAIFLT